VVDAFSDPQWVQVDLGASTTVCGVTLSRETAFARSFQIQVAPAANGPFSTELNRHVAQLPQSQWGTPSLYHQASPANWYARFWHDHAIDHLAYGFRTTTWPASPRSSRTATRSGYWPPWASSVLSQ
jgi:hypothetical protein